MKKLAAGICAIAITAGISAPVLGEGIVLEQENTEIVREMKDPANPSTTDRKAKSVISKEKWEALNDAQKEEIYRLKDISIEVECQIIDKYIEFGIVEREAGERVKAKKAEYKAEMRKSGRIPGYHEKSKKERKFK